MVRQNSIYLQVHLTAILLSQLASHTKTGTLFLRRWIALETHSKKKKKRKAVIILEMLELSVERLVWGISPATKIQEEIMCVCFLLQHYVVSSGWEHIVPPGIRFLQGPGQSKGKNSNGWKKTVLSSTLSMSHRARCYEQFSQSRKAPVLKKTNHWAMKRRK